MNIVLFTNETYIRTETGTLKKNIGVKEILYSVEKSIFTNLGRDEKLLGIGVSDSTGGKTSFFHVTKSFIANVICRL
jgi:hypothetical protein